MNLQVGVKALISNDEGLFLLIKRQEALPDGTGIRWDIPGGRIEPTEELQNALAREITEETNLRIVGTPELIAAQDIMLENIDRHIVRLTYRVQTSGTLRLSDEHQEFRWVSREEALGLETDRYLHSVLEVLK